MTFPPAVFSQNYAYTDYANNFTSPQTISGGLDIPYVLNVNGMKAEIKTNLITPTVFSFGPGGGGLSPTESSSLRFSNGVVSYGGSSYALESGIPAGLEVNAVSAFRWISNLQYTTGSYYPCLYLGSSHSDTLGGIVYPTNGTILGRIAFAGGVESNARFDVSSAITVQSSGTWSPSTRGSYLTIATTDVGSAVHVGRLRISDNGNIGIGTNITPEKLTVSGLVKQSVLNCPYGVAVDTSGVFSSCVSSQTILNLVQGVSMNIVSVSTQVAADLTPGILKYFNEGDLSFWFGVLVGCIILFGWKVGYSS